MHGVHIKGFKQFLSFSPNNNSPSRYDHDLHFTEKKTDAQNKYIMEVIVIAVSS